MLRQQPAQAASGGRHTLHVLYTKRQMVTIHAARHLRAIPVRQAPGDLCLPAISARIGLGSVCKLEPENDSRQGNHGCIVLSTFFVPGGNAPKLLEAIEEAFDTIAQAVSLSVKRT